MDFFAQDLYATMSHPGCPVCQCAAADEWQYFIDFVRYSLNDPDLRDKLLKARGFCSRHGWIFLQVLEREFGSGTPAAMLYRHLIKVELETIARMRHPRRWRKPSLRAVHLTPDLPCPACEALNASTSRQMGFFLDEMDRPYFREAYRVSEGLCGQHLLEALERSESKATSEELISHWTDKLLALREELEEFLRKLDYRYAHEPKGKEQTAWIRAVEAFVGLQEAARGPSTAPTRDWTMGGGQ
jgi:hypothetical protein